jgi:hypothetical protein
LAEAVREQALLCQGWLRTALKIPVLAATMAAIVALVRPSALVHARSLLRLERRKD